MDLPMEITSGMTWTTSVSKLLPLPVARIWALLPLMVITNPLVVLQESLIQAMPETVIQIS
jgi:hypothetical protein